MRKHRIIIGLTLILLIVGLTGCTDNNLSADRAKFIGTWYIQDAATHGILWTFIFLENGSFIEFEHGYNSYVNGTWNVKGGRLLELYSRNDTTPMILNYVFSNNDTVITLNGDTGNMVLLKQEIPK